jgi:hypothetical protein
MMQGSTQVQLQAARETVASHLSRETTRHFDVALHSAAVSSIQSMEELRSAVGDCVTALRVGDVGPVEMILAMKACALDSAKRYSPAGDDHPASNVDMLLEQIVKWAISEYYKSDS